MLLGDDIFIRGVRRGVEQGDYVYRRGDLLFGQGDPPADIRIDEQAVVMTMTYARNKGVWPRRPTGKVGEGTGEPWGGKDREKTVTPPGTTKPPPPEPEPTLNRFNAEGVLRDALTQLWEQARAKRAGRIEVLTIRMFDAGDAFRLLGAVGAVSGTDKVVTIEGGYETRDGGTFELEFRGPVPDAQPVKEFLEPQLRAAKSRTFKAEFELSFGDGLPMDGDAPETLAERLCRFASGAAYVSATVEVTP